MLRTLVRFIGTFRCLRAACDRPELACGLAWVNPG
jgi:hypothetical protein